MTPAASSHAEGEGALCTVMLQSPLYVFVLYAFDGKEIITSSSHVWVEVDKL